MVDWANRHRRKEGRDRDLDLAIPPQGVRMVHQVVGLEVFQTWTD